MLNVTSIDGLGINDRIRGVALFTNHSAMPVINKERGGASSSSLRKTRPCPPTRSVLLFLTSPTFNCYPYLTRLQLFGKLIRDDIQVQSTMIGLMKFMCFLMEKKVAF
jgi:hypothetical protein